jgi:hypothetical protein
MMALSYNPIGMTVDVARKLVYFSQNLDNVDVYTTAGKYVATIQ